MPNIDCCAEQHSGVTVVLGAQWGDEGKGKLVDFLCPRYNIICRCQGGCNAGHTVKVGDKTFKFHLLPAGVVHPSTISIIGNGCVVSLSELFTEIEECVSNGVPDVESRLLISDRAHVVTSVHVQADCKHEDSLGKNSIGTTRKGIGPCYSTKVARIGIRISDIISEDRACLEAKCRALYKFFNIEVNEEKLQQELDIFQKYKARITKICRTNIPYILYEGLQAGQTIMVEGANGAMLDIDFGTYPYVTSSNCTLGGALTGLGLSSLLIRDIIGVMKAYTTRVGDGPFPTELNDSVGLKIREAGNEFGSTTGRPRRCGWLDLVAMKYSCLINGFTRLALTKLDTLGGFDEVKVANKYRNKETGVETDEFPCSVKSLQQIEPVYRSFKGWPCVESVLSFEELPVAAQEYVRYIASFLQIPVVWIGTGPSRNQICNGPPALS